MGVRRSVTLGEELRAIRESRGLSLRALAERAGVSRSAVSNLETGTRYPTLETLEALAAALEVTIVIQPDRTEIVLWGRRNKTT